MLEIETDYLLEHILEEVEWDKWRELVSIIASSNEFRDLPIDNYLERYRIRLSIIYLRHF